MARYRLVLRDGGLVHLKTDSPFLYTYTREMLRVNNLPVNADLMDLYAGEAPIDLDIRTHYEQQWLDRGLTIKYLQWALPHAGELTEPEIEIEFDTYKSYGRGVL
jgi:tRNA (guanine-N7-)-methyltransferase